MLPPERNLWMFYVMLSQWSKMTMKSIMNRRREGLPLNAEEAAMYTEYREKKTEYQREWRNENDGYYRDYKQKRKAEMAVAVGQ